MLPVDRLFLVGSARVTNEPCVLSQRCTTLAFGQDRYAVLMECLIPRPQWVGLWADKIAPRAIADGIQLKVETAPRFSKSKHRCSWMSTSDTNHGCVVVVGETRRMIA